MPLLISGIVFSQNVMSNEEVMKPINELFEGMKKADSLLVANAFSSNATMYTSYINKEGVEVLHESSVDEFAKSIANKPKDQPDWIEKLYNTEVKIDGTLAQVWTEYSFYVGNQFSHCGVDAFNLAKLKGEWKIIQIIDTRKKEGCKQD